MKVPVRNLEFYKWSTTKKRFKVADADDDTQGVDLTGYSGVLQVWDEDKSEKLLERGSANGVDVDTSENVASGGFHYVELTMLGTALGALTFEDGIYDLFLVDGSTGYRYILATGGFLIRDSVADFS